jgi:serine/threonine protein kinase
LNQVCFSVTIRTLSFQEYPLNTDAAGNAPPDAFGPFRVLHQIGAGALGPVFRAYQPEQDRLVAVKLFRIDLPPERTYQLVVQLERLIAADLTHAGIAAPLATGISDLAAYLAMDFVAADSLDIVIRDQQLSAPADVVRVASQLASALDLAAAIDITHGALHPRDVLLSTDDARMTGIGIARALEEVGSSAPIRRPYTAPERTSGAAWDRRADVFSLAALVFELLTRRRISGPGDQPLDSFAGVRGVTADALNRVFDRGLAEQPGDRFATAGDFAKALQAAVERKRSVAGRVGPTVRAPIPTPIVEPMSTPAQPDELPLFTDSLLGEKPDSASDVPPPPILDVSHEALSPDLSFRDAPLSMVESMHEPDRSSMVDHVIDDFHPARHDASESRLSIDDFTEAMHDRSNQQHDDSLPVEPHAEAPRETAPKRRERDFDLDEGFAREAAEMTSRPAPFESMDSAPGRSSSGVWPLMLALVVGIALGFGMAMLMLGRDRVPPVPQQAIVAPSGGRAAAEVRDEPIREVTEQTVATPPKPAAPVPAEPSAPASVARPGAPTPVKPSDSTGRIDNVPPPQGRTPVVPGTTPAPSKATVPPTKPATSLTKPVASATKPSGTATKAAAAPAPGRGASKAVAATPAKPATPPPVKTAAGSLVVDSRPAGAAVFLDGRRVGTTPLVLDTLKVGDYTIGLDITGYKRWASTVKVTSGERSRVAASLER